MRNLLVGLVLGCVATLLVVVAWLATRDARVERVTPQHRLLAVEPSTPLVPAASDPATGSRAEPARERRRRSTEPSARFAPGTARLRVGDRYVLGEDRVRESGDARPVDLVCEDVRQFVGVATPQGSEAAALPAIVPGNDFPDLPTCFALVSDAPPELAQARAVLTSAPGRGGSGVSLVRSVSGDTYKVRMASVSRNPNVLERVATLVFERVAVRAGGGEIPIEGALDARFLSADEMTTLRLLRDPPDIPSLGFTGFGRGDYARLEGAFPAQLSFDERRYLVADDPFATEVEFNRYSGLYARDGIAATGRVKINSYTGVLVEKDMAGTIDVDSYAYLRIAGDLTGTVVVDSYASVIVEGSVLGMLDIRSYTTAFVKGRFVDPPNNLRCSSTTTLYLGQYTSQLDIERFENVSSATLHVRESDLPLGEHTGIGPWDKVIVGDALWERIAR